MRRRKYSDVTHWKQGRNYQSVDLAIEQRRHRGQLHAPGVSPELGTLGWSWKERAPEAHESPR